MVRESKVPTLVALGNDASNKPAEDRRSQRQEGEEAGEGKQILHRFGGAASGSRLVEGEIELQDVDACITQDAEIGAVGIRADDRQNFLDWEAASFGDA